VLLDEAVTALVTATEGIYVDATFGRGGHAAAILARLGQSGRLIAFDRDPEAIASGSGLAADGRLALYHANFSQMGEILARLEIGGVDGILLDLGVSSPQLDDADRGFSFRLSGPLDMRMDPTQGQSAASWLASADEAAIADVLFRFGEERQARRIARAIVQDRQQSPFTTTRQLAELVARVSPGHERGKHPATRTFQALRIFINGELTALEQLLPQSLSWLKPGGRLVVISFHSLEDRIVKRFIQFHSRSDQAPPDLPLRAVENRAPLRAIGRAQFPSLHEVAANPRARSAVLRVAERVAA
jgi:16S rRNA (cytosine1402-N4)-methyltransferase